MHFFPSVITGFLHLFSSTIFFLFSIIVAVFLPHRHFWNTNHFIPFLSVTLVRFYTRLFVILNRFSFFVNEVRIDSQIRETEVTKTHTHTHTHTHTQSKKKKKWKTKKNSKLFQRNESNRIGIYLSCWLIDKIKKQKLLSSGEWNYFFAFWLEEKKNQTNFPFKQREFQNFPS